MIKVNGFPVNVTMFPDKTSQVWKLSDDLIKSINEEDYVITWNFEHEGEIFHIYQLIYLLQKLDNSENKSNKKMIFDCPYLPYARQDKTAANDSCFALTVFCAVFGWVNELRTFDVHNPSFFKDKNVQKETNHNFKFVNILPYKEIEEIIADESIDLIVYPDKGASARYPQLSAKYKWVAADKVRDQLTGEITGMTMPDINEGLNILVADDLADGARSMIELAKLINKYNPKGLILYVSHGIFSKGTKIVFDSGYDKIFTKDGEVSSYDLDSSGKKYKR